VVVKEKLKSGFEIGKQGAKKVEGKARRASWKPRKMVPDRHELALDLAIRKYAKKKGIDLKEIAKKYDERELLKHASDVLWNFGLDWFGDRYAYGKSYKERAKEAVMNMKRTESEAEWDKEEDPFPKHIIRWGSLSMSMAAIQMDKIGRIRPEYLAIMGSSAGSIAAAFLKRYTPAWEMWLREEAPERFKYHIKNAPPEEVVKTYLALKALQKKEIPGSFASRIRSIYMRAMRKAIEEHLEELKNDQIS